MSLKAEPEDTRIPLATFTPAQILARKDAVKALTSLRRAAACQLHRWPSEKHICTTRTKIHLPRAYLGKEGEDVRAVHPGTDLNQFVFRHYDQLLSEVKEHWVNFVTVDNVSVRRHEFLGPDPRVAGFFFDVDGEIHVRWWDGFLKDQWMDRQKWIIRESDLVLNEKGDWVEDS
ncbi:hypothetical protein BV25DRAFT_1819728 [Artomyces pyxidatus]|uniref:Uncharacterized protein n=1 Tax=Artomyces pyxidatus TaxID=48021 RepID=A0ACB8TG67_9AGAM|nr:hypothetical protein BV25DRAFT_1819728 [Artomyces pyxidatus]